jgi:hypothetical protein
LELGEARMLKAWYYANSQQYGRHFGEVATAVNCYLDWEPDNATTRKLPPGKKLYVCLNIGWQGRTAAEAIEQAIRWLRPAWSRVAALEIADEPDMTAAELNAASTTIRAALKKAGLAPRPIGATFTGTAILKGQAWKATLLDWVGVEAYVEYKAGEPPAKAAARVRAHIAAQLARVAPRRVVLIAQSYDRNGTWDNEASLVALQRPTFEAARALGARLLMLTMFAWARPGGAREYPVLRAELLKLCREF